MAHSTRLKEGENDFVRISSAINQLAEKFDRLTIKPSFRAHKGGTNQTGLVNGAYTKVTFTTEAFDNGSLYDAANSRWTPPAGPIVLTCACYCVAHAASSGSPTFVVKLFKNGSTDVAAGVGTAMTGFPTLAIAHVAAVDNASGTDYYEAEFFFTSDDASNDGALDGNPFHTYFSGSAL